MILVAVLFIAISAEEILASNGLSFFFLGGGAKRHLWHFSHYYSYDNSVVLRDRRNAQVLRQNGAR